MRPYFIEVFLALLTLALTGCAPEVKVRDIKMYLEEIESKVQSTGPETLRQAEEKAMISRPLTEAYKASVAALSNRAGPAIISPLPPDLSNESQLRITYADREPVFHEGKPIVPTQSQGPALSGSSYIEDLRIYVTIFLEAQGPDATVVYFYPHHGLCYRIPAELRAVVDANMAYRGRQFVDRLQTQVASKGKWQWLTN